MGRHIILWEADESKIPVDAAERQAGWQMATEWIRQNMEDGLVKDWGAFMGQTNGFSIAEGTDDAIINFTAKFSPFFRFKVIPISSIDQVEAVIKNIA